MRFQLVFPVVRRVKFRNHHRFVYPTRMESDLDLRGQNPLKRQAYECLLEGRGKGLYRPALAPTSPATAARQSGRVPFGRLCCFACRADSAMGALATSLRLRS